MWDIALETPDKEIQIHAGGVFVCQTWQSERGFTHLYLDFLVCYVPQDLAVLDAVQVPLVPPSCKLNNKAQIWSHKFLSSTIVNLIQVFWLQLSIYM